MNLGKFSLMKEDPASYHIGHPSGKTLVVGKAGLSDKAHKLVKGLKKFADGGEVDPSADASPVQDSPDQIAADAAAQSAPSTASAELAQAPAPVTGTPAGASGAATSPVLGQDNAANLEAEKQIVLDAVTADAGVGNAEAAGYAQMAKIIPTAEVLAQQKAAFDAKDKQLFDAYASQKLDPNRYYKNMSTGSRIGAGIGFLLSGMGSATTGQPAMAQKFISDAVDRDIDAQKNDQGKAMNLWKMNREKYQNDQAATAATQNQLLNGVKFNIMAAQGKAAGSQAALRTLPMLSDINSKIAQNNRYLSVRGTQDHAGVTGGLLDADPATLVPYMVHSPDQQKQAYEEIGRAQNVARNSDNIMKTFDQAAKTNTVLGTGAGYLRTPGEVMALHQLLLPNFKQIDGTVRQAAMDETFHNVTPSPGDSDHKIAEKRQALQDWMHSETAATVSKGNGLDLSKYKSTAVQDTPPIQTAAGRGYQRQIINGKAYMVPVK